jgi:hypothetical protein
MGLEAKAGPVGLEAKIKAAAEEKRAAALLNTPQAKQQRAAASKQALKDKIASYQGNPSEVAAIIGAGDVKFLSANWLLDCPDYWRIARSQDLPREAFLAPEDAEWLYQRLGGLVIVSYPWLARNHPDPQGFHFHNLQLYLRVHLQHFLGLMKSERINDIGVFWDFASLVQPSAKGERTSQEQQILARAMKTIEFLYGGQMSIVVQLKQMPVAAFENMNRTPYDGRGWCYFEEVVSSVSKSTFQSLNIALVQDRLEEFSCEWNLVASMAQNEKKVPMHPDQLKQELILRSFTIREDCDILLAKYTEFFHSFAASALDLSLPQQTHISGGRPWGQKEVDYLIRALPSFGEQPSGPKQAVLKLGEMNTVKKVVKEGDILNLKVMATDGTLFWVEPTADHGSFTMKGLPGCAGMHFVQDKSSYTRSYLKTSKGEYLMLNQQGVVTVFSSNGERKCDPGRDPCLEVEIRGTSSLMKLNLRGRSLGDIGAEKLAKVLPNLNALEILWINNCDIGNKGITALAPAIRELKELIDLKLHGSRFNNAGLRELCDVTLFPFTENSEAAVDLQMQRFGHNRKDCQLVRLEDLTLPSELANSAAAEVLNRLVKMKASVTRLMVKWI